jgi:predicted short-subunit dehydrogenase-like oxidoreductase (DUF2520 family)
MPLAGIVLRERSLSPADRLLEVRRASLDELLGSSDIILAAVSDHSLSEIAGRLAAAPPDVALLHCSGSLTSAVFNRPNGFSLHPLLALPAVGKSSTLRNVLLVFEGPPGSRQIAEEIARITGALLATVSGENKPLYHAAAVFASNYIAALLHLAESLMRDSGVAADGGGAEAAPELRDALAQLARSAVENWRANRGGQAFTGPVIRGERDVVRRHLDALGRRPELIPIYRDLAGYIARATPGASTTEEPGDPLDLWLAKRPPFS